MSAITYLLLDADYDPVFDPNAALTDLDAVRQVIVTRLWLFMGEWWENLNLGLPVFQSILGQLASPSGIAAMQALIQQNILGTPYVTGVTSVGVNFTTGRLSYTTTVQTAFGTVVTNGSTPGLSASLGS
jgi:hypothetical protein